MGKFWVPNTKYTLFDFILPKTVMGYPSFRNCSHYMHKYYFVTLSATSLLLIFILVEVLQIWMGFSCIWINYFIKLKKLNRAQSILLNIYPLYHIFHGVFLLLLFQLCVWRFFFSHRRYLYKLWYCLRSSQYVTRSVVSSQ